MNLLRTECPDALAALRVQRGKRTEFRLWQAGGGYHRQLVSARAIRSSIEYLHANPVRKGLVSNPTDWRWSSARWYSASPLLIDIAMDSPRVVLE